MYTDLSIDLETLGVRPGCVITQIGLCAFNALASSEAESVYATTLIHIDPQSCFNAGMHASWNTIAWWLEQSPEARRLMVMPEGIRHSLRSALIRTSEFVNQHCDSEARIWGHGATFDVTLMEAAYEIVKLPVPWSFRNVRDLRTLADLGPCLAVVRPKAAMEHNAMADAVAQATWIQRLMQEIK